ncbi:hypothetical protein [Haloarcula marismortui]|uniref:hypothetical protein n=1 Tax=Haloarcula marismortui TaxID=2238 RepID=UPI00137887CF|nr:hypothetical protein [Haloarcula californiae]
MEPRRDYPTALVIVKGFQPAVIDPDDEIPVGPVPASGTDGVWFLCSEHVA